jgi:plastocyanin
MRRLRAVGTWSLVLLAVLVLVGAPMAAPAQAAGYVGFGWFPGHWGCPFFGAFGFAACPGFGAFPGFGVGHGFGAFPGFGVGHGFGAFPGFGVAAPTTAPAVPGFGAFPGFGVAAPATAPAVPGFGAFPGAALSAPVTAAEPAAAMPLQRVRLSMGDNFFLPAEISFPAGTQIAWVNNGRDRHTTTAPGIWDSGPINPGGRWAAIFAVAGTFEYTCTIHPNEMRGRLVITTP